jgi:hypothetical protein
MLVISYHGPTLARMDALSVRTKTPRFLPNWSAPVKVVQQLGYFRPLNWRISDGWKTREARRDCIEASVG